MRIAVWLLLSVAMVARGAEETPIDVALAASAGNLAEEAERGDPAAQFAYGQTLEREGRPQLAFRWFLAAARQGMPLAQMRVAELFLAGELFPPSEEQAFRWYSLAAAAREPDAEYALGESYEFGRGTSPSLPTALSWYARAADNPRLFRRGSGYAIPDGVLSARMRLRNLCGTSGGTADPEVASACDRYGRAVN